MNNYFVTLVGPLYGYCILVIADSEEDVRQWAHDTLGKIWCHVLDKRPRELLIGQTIHLGDE